jgi:urease accessory protein
MPETFRAVAVVRHGEKSDATAFELAVLPHDERRVRRRMIPLVHGDGVLVDFPEPVTLDNHDCLKLEDGRLVEIIAAEEKLYDVRGTDDLHVMRLAWHLGNRHLKAQIERQDGDGPLRILILRDHVIRDMLRTLGATIIEVSEPFYPEEGAYSHSHGEPVHALLNR